MRAAVIQSNYLPWKGYFDVIQAVDLFVFYDDTQYTTRDWRNRNLIKTAHGPLWLTVPVMAGSRDLVIEQVEIAGREWAANHWKSLQHHYAAAPYLKPYREFFQHVYLEREWTHLSELNQFLIMHIAREFLGIQTRFMTSTALAAEGRQQARLLDVLGKVGATTYLSGPAARAYIDPAGFEAAGVALEYMDYGGYPEYAQFHPPFAHGMTVLDLLFHAGPAAPELIWGWRELRQRIPRAAQPLVIEDAR
ncbi:MAG: hypothetical protein JWM80_1489 [Cyanobacteria bacterium RYN_339]|nr:hypothetical protein [Cyanobacteria bacterium RYN_339]